MAKDPKYANMVKCINSDKLIEMLPKNINSYISVAAVIKIINNLPAADVQEVKHGQWESTKLMYENGCTRCSECKTGYYVSDLKEICGDILPTYCQHCGARMDG